jgi:cytochrome P450
MPVDALAVFRSPYPVDPYPADGALREAGPVCRDDAGRWLATTYEAALSLASGAHSCTGAGLARLEASVAVERFLTRLPRAAVGRPPVVRDDIRRLRGYACLPVAVGTPA